MLLIFNPSRTSAENDELPPHGVRSPPESLHFALEIREQDYQGWKELLDSHKIALEKDVSWESGSRSLYFRDPAGNLVELMTPGSWPVES